MAEELMLTETIYVKSYYDREMALRIFHTLQPLLPREGWQAQQFEGYLDSDKLSDDDRVILCYELLGGALGNSLIGELAFFEHDNDRGIELSGGAA